MGACRAHPRHGGTAALRRDARPHAHSHLVRGVLPGPKPCGAACGVCFWRRGPATDYARAMADGGCWPCWTCLGLAQLSHETTSYLVQLCCTTLVFFGFARWASIP